MRSGAALDLFLKGVTSDLKQTSLILKEIGELMLGELMPNTLKKLTEKIRYAATLKIFKRKEFFPETSVNWVKKVVTVSNNTQEERALRFRKPGEGGRGLYGRHIFQNRAHVTLSRKKLELPESQDIKNYLHEEEILRVERKEMGLPPQKEKKLKKVQASKIFWIRAQEKLRYGNMN